MQAVIVSDGKKGHVNQSFALAEYLGAQCIQVLPVKCWEPVSDFAARFFSCLISPRNYPPVWRRALLHRLLGTSSPEPPAGISGPVVVIATGTLTAAASLALAGELGARALQVLRASFVPYRAFDAVLIPQHDAVARLPANVAALPIALGPVSGKNAGDSLAELQRRMRVSEFPPGEYAAVLVGGDSAHYKMGVSSIRASLERIAELAAKSGVKVLLTTSRRTSEAVEASLRALAEATPGVFAFCVWGRADQYNPIPAYLELAKAVIATEESVSMVSEAVLSGHRLLIIPVAHRGRSRKFQRFYRFLLERKLVRKLSPEGMWDGDWEYALKSPRQSQPEVASSIGLPVVLAKLRNLLRLEGVS